MAYRLYIINNVSRVPDAVDATANTRQKAFIYEDGIDNEVDQNEVEEIAQWKNSDMPWFHLNKVHGGKKSISILSLKSIDGITFNKKVKKEGWVIDERDGGTENIFYINDRKELARYLIENDRRNDMHNFIDFIGSNIKKLRINNGLTQEHLAREINVYVRTLQRWEQGTTKPDINGLNKLISYFDIPYEDLINKEL